MKYAIRIQKEAPKELSGLPAKHSQAISNAIDQFSEIPRPVGSKKLKGEKRIFGEYGWNFGSFI